MIFFLLDCNKIHKNQKFSAFDIFEPRSKEMRLVSHITCIDLVAPSFFNLMIIIFVFRCADPDT